MGIFTILGAVFSSWRIYMLIGIVVALVLIGGYIEYLRADVANAKADLAGANATISVTTAALTTDQQTIANLQTEREADQTALRSVAQSSQQSAAAISKIKDQLNAIPVPACNALDARDRAAIGGVRSLLHPRSGAPDQHREGSSAAGTP